MEFNLIGEILNALSGHWVTDGGRLLPTLSGPQSFSPDRQYSIEVLCLGHRGVTFCVCAAIGFTIFLALVALATFCRCYQCAILAVGS